MIKPPDFALTAYAPSECRLLETVAGLVTDDMLREISKADYGHNASLHLARLRAIHRDLTIPSRLEWEPKEVLELVRWSQPEGPKWKPGSTRKRGHIMRAFSCAVLLLALADPANYDYMDGDNQTLIQMIDSAFYLDQGLPGALASFLNWRISLITEVNDETPFYAFGLAAIVLLAPSTALNHAHVDEMVEFVSQTEVRSYGSEEAYEALSGASFLTKTYFTQLHKAWRVLAARLQSRYPHVPSLVGLCRGISES